MVQQFYLTLDETLIGTTTSGPSVIGKKGNEKVLLFPKAPGLESRHQIQFSIIPRKPVVG